MLLRTLGDIDLTLVPTSQVQSRASLRSLQVVVSHGELVHLIRILSGKAKGSRSMFPAHGSPSLEYLLGSLDTHMDPKHLCLLCVLPAEKSLEQELVTPILDIEDLVKSGSRHK